MNFRSTLPEPFTDRALRKLLSFCAKEIGFPIRRLRRVDFLRTGKAFSGRWYPRQSRMSVRVGSSLVFPVRYSRFGIEKVVVDQWSAIVSIAAHEFAHGNDLLESGKTNERSAELQEKRVRDKFEANRAALLAEWTRQEIGK